MDALTGRVALVTGGGRGIGRAIAMGLARAGCDVAVSYRERQGAADNAAREIREIGRQSVAIQADVSRSGDVNQMAQAVESELGAVGILVNNAGGLKVQRMEEITEADWNQMLAVNL